MADTSLRNLIGEWSRTVQAAFGFSVLIHVIIVAVLVYLYEGPDVRSFDPLKIEIQGLTIFESPVVEPEEITVPEQVLPTAPPEVEEESIPVESETQIDQTVDTRTVEIEPTQESTDRVVPEVPVAVLVSPDSLEAFVTEDNLGSRIPSFKSLEQQLRQESYFDSWADKISEFGRRSLNRSSGNTIHGEVTLEVVLRMDGSLESVVLKQSSRSAFLDSLALQLVRVAQPYAPVPKKLLNNRGKLIFQPKIVFRNKLAWVE